MKRIIVLCLMLSACGSTPKPPVGPAVVSVPVSVTCVPKMPAKPVYATEALELVEDNIFVLVQALLIERKQRQAYEVEQTAALTGCAK